MKNTNVQEKYPLRFGDRKKEKEKLVKRYEKAIEIAHSVSELLKEKFDAETVWIFGSLTDKKRFNKWSDIDIAIKGIKPEKFYSAVGKVLYESEGFKIDIIDYEDCKRSIFDKINEEGIKI